MKTLRYSLLLLATLLFCTLSAQESQKDLERLMAIRGEYFFTLHVSDLSEIQAISDLCSIDNVANQTVIGYANQRQYEELLLRGYQPQLQTPPSLREKPIMYDPQRGEYEWDSYLTYEQYETMMQQFATAHPERCTYFELGTLASGRKLMFCRINNGQPDGKPRFLYTSTIHGDELTGMILMLRLIDELCTSNDARIVNLIDNLDIFICPNTNPDGTYHTGNHTVEGATRKNANEIDLNRHYPDFDKGPHPDNEWCYQDETRWLMDLAQEHLFTMAANYHGGSEVMNYPWDTHPSLHPDDEWWKLVCHEYADQCHEWNPDYMNPSIANSDNGIVNGYLWYTISGSRQDYMNYYAQCREVTIECSNVYTPNASMLPTYWNYNHNSILSYMEQCLNGIHGTVTDAETGAPIEATISIEGHDHHGSEVSSHLPAGDYHRVIKGGTYDVTYSAYGYVSQTHTLSVNDYEAIRHDVQLVPESGNVPIEVSFEVGETMITTGTPFKFYETCKGRRIIRWAWQFPGGTPSTSTERNPYVSYENAGQYDVTLTVTDADGQSATLTKTQLIDVYSPFPMTDGEMVLSDCRGLLLPSGGACGHYGNNENYTMILRPEDSDSKISVNFLKFNTQAGSDVLRIYDGTSTNAPLLGIFSGSQLPNSLTATNPEGALTFTFISDARFNYYGWLATLSCIGGQSVDESASTRLKVYPNPSQGQFTIESEEEVSYTLYTPLGQRLLSGKGKGSITVQTDGLGHGIYFLHLSGTSVNETEKLIIEK